MAFPVAVVLTLNSKPLQSTFVMVCVPLIESPGIPPIVLEESTPATVTLSPKSNPLLKQSTKTVDDAESVKTGLSANSLLGTAAFCKTICACAEISNCALWSLNFRSCSCAGVNVLPLWE